MRLWSLHPSLLDPKGLTAAWREALLAQAVLAGRTRGYRHHPQLKRFLTQNDPQAAIAAYLASIWEEASARGYSYDRSRIDERQPITTTISVTSGQVRLELEHLRLKLLKRHPATAASLPLDDPPLHPLFFVVEGPVEEWERNEVGPPAKRSASPDVPPTRVLRPRKAKR